MQTRRTMLLGTALAGLFPIAPAGAREGAYPVTRTDAEWRRLLSRAQYNVLRRDGTEAPGSSPLDREKRSGDYACAGCNQVVFRSADKYDSRTGWPAFTRPVGGAVGTSMDESLGVRRIAVHCASCGGHLGHVFDDGPAPAGKRYCINGVAMRFSPGPG